MKKFTPTLLAALSPVMLLAGPQEREAAPDKSGYHLFNPTPTALMREMSTDRPDQTESAYTADAGHFQSLGGSNPRIGNRVGGTCCAAYMEYGAATICDFTMVSSCG